MGLIFMIIILVLSVTGVSAFFISRKVLKILKEKENPNALLISIVTFIAVFAAILMIILYLVATNVYLGR